MKIALREAWRQKWIARGSRITGQLEISETSVKWVMQQLFEKTGVRTRSQLVRIALEKHSQIG